MQQVGRDWGCWGVQGACIFGWGPVSLSPADGCSLHEHASLSQHRAPPLLARQVSLCPVWVNDVGGLRESVQALPPSLTSLDLLPSLGAVRERGGAGGEWRLEMLPGWMSWPDVYNLQRVCAAFDRPGLPCCLTGAVRIRVVAPEEAGPGALSAYLGQCAELAGRLRGGRTGGLDLTLEVDDEGYGRWTTRDGGFLGRVLGAVLPAAAPHVRRLRVLLDSGFFMPGFSSHMVAPLAFPLLEELELDSDAEGRSMADADVAALAQLDAPRLCRVGLLSPADGLATGDEGSDGGAGSSGGSSEGGD